MSAPLIADRTAKRQDAGTGSRDDPYRWGRIVAHRTLYQCCTARQARNRDDREEVESVANLTVARCLRYYQDDRSRLSTYIAKAVIREIRRWVHYEFRRRETERSLDPVGFRTVMEDEELGCWETCSEASARDEYELGDRERLAVAIGEALLRVPADDREAVYAYYWRGNSLREAAPLLGLSPEGVRRRVKRGERRLAVLLEGKWA